MNPTLRNLLRLVGIVLVSGAPFVLYVLKDDATPADAIAAGIGPTTVPARLTCRVRIKESCRDLPDGGLRPRYVNVGVKARKSKPDSGEDFVAFDLPNAWTGCLTPVGTPAEACQVLEDGVCTDATICAANAPPVPEVDACACSSGPTCLQSDGGLAKQGITLAAGTWSGLGCVRKYCGPEIAGEQGQSWPPVCPQ